MKTLLVFAHAGEAQAFFEARLPETDILITKEGLTDSLFTLARHLGQHSDYNKIINLGIAGSLSPKSELGQIYSIKTVYAENEFKSFGLFDEKANMDCISSLKRVNKKEEKTELGRFAPLVDRELWSLAYVASKFQIPLFSYKLVSDLADESLVCVDIKEKSLGYSQRLLDFYQKLQFIKAEEKADLFPGPWEKHFHFSHSQRLKLNDLCQRLQSSEHFTEELLADCLAESKIPKERTQFLLKKLSLALNPFMEKIENELSKLVSPLTEVGAKVHFSPDFEENYFSLSMKIEHEKNLSRLSSALLKIDFEKFKRCQEGKHNV